MQKLQASWLFVLSTSYYDLWKPNIYLDIFTIERVYNKQDKIVL